jgi:hypothetical protein
MVDYVKLVSTSESVANYMRKTYCPRLDNMEHETGDISTAIYKGKIGNEFEVSVYRNNVVILRGSLHKYYVQGGNFGDFTFSMLCKAVKQLAEELQAPPESLIIQNLEIGVNLALAFNPNAVLNGVVSTKGGKPFNTHSNTVLSCQRGEYRLKIYNKSAQYGITDKHILRYELHIDKMRKIAPVKTLQDLTKIQNWYMFQQVLLKHFSEVVFIDYYPSWETLTAPERNFLIKHTKNINNPRFWKTLSDKNRHDIFKTMKRLQDQKGEKKYSLLLTELIEQKTTELTNL